jgi:hypothetical protein
MLFCLLRSVKDVTAHYTGGGSDCHDDFDNSDYERKRELEEIVDTPQELTNGSIRSHILRSPISVIHENATEIMTLLAQGYHYERIYGRIG